MLRCDLKDVCLYQRYLGLVAMSMGFRVIRSKHGQTEVSGATDRVKASLNPHTRISKHRITDAILL